MKNKELIKLLMQFGDDIEVCVFDFKTNLRGDSGEGSSDGIYSRYDIELMDKDNIPDGCEPWVAISFDNRLLDDDGLEIEDELGDETETVSKKSVTDVQEICTKIPDSVTAPVGNDDLLAGIPKDLDEAIEMFLEYYRSAPEIKIISDLPEEKFSSFAHHGSGQFIRNNWYLWWYEGHQYAEWPKSKPPLVGFFNQRDISHADDMSSLVICAAWCKVNNVPFNLEERIKGYHAYWKENGFPDGIPKTN